MFRHYVNDMITYTGGAESSGFGSDMISNKISIEKPTLAFSGEERYLTKLWVSRKADELYDPSQDGFELSADNIDQHTIHDKMKTVLKMLVFREQQVLVQFWSPRVVGKHRLLTTIDQPFGLGLVNEELYSYRRDSEHKFYDVHKDHGTEDLSPPARVFRLGLPEWTSNITNYVPKDFPQKECAIRCNLNGYLALPVFNLTTGSRVGVIELLTSSKHPSYAYEVQQFQRALKTQNLTCDGPVSDVINEGRRNELEKIFSVLRIVCDYYRLSLAQTWAVSSLSTIASHEQVLRMSCNSFDSRCLGKVCMSTCGLPYYVKDLALWPFLEACMERHLDKFCGLVGRALLSLGSCYCEDVTKLSEEEYPLVHFARMHGLTGSFAIHLHSVETNDDYVLEFFLPSHMKDIKHVLNLVQLLKHYFEVASQFELGDKSFIEVVGPPMDLCVNIEPDTMDTFSDVQDIARTDFVDVPDECSSTSVSTASTEGGETSKPLEQGRKYKRASKNMVYVKATYGENSKGFWFSIPSGLWKLKNKVAKRFKLKRQMIRLKYWDEDNDLILFSSNDDLEFAKIASGNNNRINLICEGVRHRVD
ncbi:NIN-like protein [Artemisia annua]|uniref:NIN-like protein n=1 Tax=Artemisia annua TaxID=35608 RepID=A0A2U1NVM3_ARTAN|nr:NIN-like protein [Artemisia annua]